MAEFKFEIGQIIKPKQNLKGKYFKVNGKYMTTDTTITITSRHLGRYGIAYGFEEDKDYAGKPNWLRIEENFEPAEICNWREVLK